MNVSASPERFAPSEHTLRAASNTPPKAAQTCVHVVVGAVVGVVVSVGVGLDGDGDGDV